MEYRWDSDGLDGHQVPFGVRAELASTFNLPDTSVRVIVPDTGSLTAGSIPASVQSRQQNLLKQQEIQSS